MLCMFCILVVICSECAFFFLPYALFTVQHLERERCGGRCEIFKFYSSKQNGLKVVS